MKRKIALLLLCLGLSACTGKRVYQVIQENRLQTCEQEVRHSTYEKCKQAYSQSYEVYESQRRVDSE